MSNIRHRAKVCGQIVYTYTFTAREVSLSSDISDIDYFGVSPSYRSSDSYLSALSRYRAYLKQFDLNVSERFQYYLDIGFSSDLSYSLATSFYKFDSDYFGLTSISESALARSRRRLRDLVYTNIDSSSTTGKFITLTYSSPQFSPSQLKQHFKTFIQRLRYSLKTEFRYIAVPEKHQSSKTSPDRYGSYHIHILIFDTGFLDNYDLTSIWSHGFTYIKKLYGDPTSVANYVAKYVTKDLSIDFGRRFLYSRNCLRPIETSDFSELPPLKHVSSSVYTALSGEKLHFTINRVLS